MPEALIVSAARTGVGKFLGTLKDVPATDLGAIVVRESVARAGVDPALVEDVIMGCVLPAGLGQNPARQAAIHGGIPAAAGALTESLRMARDTHWDSVRSPHVFMGLLAKPDAGVNCWGKRLGADLPKLLDQFRELFHQEEGEKEALLVLNREFLSDNVIRLLREARCRACKHRRKQITQMDLLITLLTASNSIVADCFDQIGVTAKLTEQAVIAEHTCKDRDNGERSAR